MNILFLKCMHNIKLQIVQLQILLQRLIIIVYFCLTSCDFGYLSEFQLILNHFKID